jgi:hypothetical protein
MQLTETITPASVETHLSGLTQDFREIFLKTAPDLKTELARITFLRTKTPDHHHLLTYRTDGFSTFEWEGRARIQFAPLFFGGFVIRRTLLGMFPVQSVTDHYDVNGKHLGKMSEPLPNLLYVNLTDMEPECAITSHLYNILAHEYEQAVSGAANSGRIVFIESFLRDHAGKGKERFSWYQDPEPSLEHLNAQIRHNESDPALTFKEKAIVRAKLKAERKQVLNTKKRVHGKVTLPHHANFFRKDITARLIGFKERPQEKAAGILYQYTIGVILWFFTVVRSNIGYSVALAIYAPFTYYFITQPMNPGAMWAVGEVRKVFLATTALTNQLTGGDASTSANSNVSSAATTGAAAIAATSAATSGPTEPFDPSTPFSNTQKFKPRFDGMLISTDIPSVDRQSWNDRMSNFKDMQIAYESNLQFSQRMGRLEQMELQLNFAVIAESSYREIEHYAESLTHVRETLVAKSAYSKEAAAYLDGETNRLKQFKLYLWDKMVRYMLDHPYVVLNEAKDQSFIDYYVGRNFIFLEELTTSLSKEYQGFKKPKGFKTIEELSKFYSEKKVAGDSVEDRLNKNSVLHRLTHKYNGVELRERLKRQWEILFLSYNRAQEPANFGLQLYVWSVRNAVWSMGALFTAKSREMESILSALQADESRKADALVKLKDAQRKMEPLIESLFHILSLEYVSIREELNKKLQNDLDSTQRQVLIEGIEKSFSERTAFLKSLPFGQ